MCLIMTKLFICFYILLILVFFFMSFFKEIVLHVTIYLVNNYEIYLTKNHKEKKKVQLDMGIR